MTGKTFISAALAAASIVLAVCVQSAMADICMEDRYFAATGGHLNCTANDVRIARVTNITNPATGEPVTSCIAGEDVTFQADFEVVLTAQARYDIGLYLATDGDLVDGALNGQCARSIITPLNAPATFIQLDLASQPADVCGDINAAKNPQIVHMALTTKCVAGVGGKLALPNCTSWRQPGSNEVCLGVDDAYPGAPSKCNCDKNFTIDVIVETPTLVVVKNATPTTVLEPEGSVQFTFQVTNAGQYTSLNLQKLVDDPDFNPATLNSIVYDGTSTPTLAAICDKLQLAPGETAFCTIPTRIVSGNPGDTITDQACVSGTSTNGLPFGPVCATASVSIQDVKPTAAVTKTLGGLPCAVVTFNVAVENTDPVEPLLLTRLIDSAFGDITKVEGAVLRTDCIVPQTIGIREIGNPDSGRFSCSFDFNLCAIPVSNTLKATDTVTATLSDNDSNVITPVSNEVTVTVTATTP